MRPPPCADAGAPLAAGFVPGPHDILRSLAAWDGASADERLARAQALERLLPGFALRGLDTFACGGQRHEVALYVDEPTHIEFVLVPCGSLTYAAPCGQGAGGTITSAVDAPFLVARTELTCGAWNAEMPANIEGDASLAAGGISWFDALDYCRRRGYDLPSQAQWNLACHAGATTRNCFGDDCDRYVDLTWNESNSGDVLHAVGQMPPNAFGLFDVHGNAREWCRDCGPAPGRRILLGQGADGCARSQRRVRRATTELWAIGFRPVYTIAEPEAQRPSADEVLRVYARGVQIYRCVEDADGTPSWTFVGPRADLFDTDGRRAGTHHRGESGPVWELGGTHVVGTKLAERPSPNSGSIPELELSARTLDAGGAPGTIALIDRIRTLGGSEPATFGRHAGDIVEVPYTAVYVFRTQTR